MRRRTAASACFSGFALLAANLAEAGPGDGVTAISIFKNGFASVTREFAVKGTSMTIEVPPASLGTLFFTTDDGSSVTIEALPGSASKRTVPLQSMGDLLRANVGKPVTLRVAEGGVLVGEIRSVGQDVVTLKSSDGLHILPISRVQELSSTKGDLRLEVDVTSPVAPRSYRITKSKAGGNVRMTSLEPGLSWVPSYRIDLSDPKEATVIAGSTIFNDDYDLKGVKARLVTGFPAARYRNVPEALVSSAALPEWLAALASPEAQPPLRRQAAMAPASNSYGGSGFISYDPTDNSLIVNGEYGRSLYGSGFGGGMGGGMGGMGGGGFGGYSGRQGYDGIEQGGGNGETLGELFFYEIPPLTLTKGVRRLQSLFQFNAPYRHVNTFELGPEYDENLNPVRRNQSDNFQASLQRYYSRQATEEDLRLLREAIWHEVEFQNRADQPLTGAVGSLVEREELIGQGTVDYTPPGGTAVVRLDRALDLVLDRHEEQILREPGAVKSTWNNGYTYDRITMKGTLSIRNPRAESVIVKGRKRTIGEMTAATPNATITKTSPLVRGINGTSVAAWEVTIAPGATAKLEYTYTLLTAR